MENLSFANAIELEEIQDKVLNACMTTCMTSFNCGDSNKGK